MSIYRLLVVFLGALCAAHAPVAAQDRETLSYTVQAGDTLYGISRRYLISTSAVNELQRLNDVQDPRRLPIAKDLEIPIRLLRFETVELSVAFFAGDVRIANAAVGQQGLILRERQLVTTGPNSFVTFTTRFGGRISLPSNSRARLLRARRYALGNTLDVDFEVQRGRGSAGSPPLQGQDRLRLRTPSAVTAVRGTEFRTAYDEAQGGVSRTEVLEGVVAVTAGGVEREASAGFGVFGGTQGVSPPEELLPPPEIVRPGAIQTGENLEFTFEPVTGARATRVQLARDAGFLDILSERVVEGGTAIFEPLPNDRYFVRARSISDNGLEGASDPVAATFRRVRLGVAPTGGEPTDLGGFLFRWAPAGEGAITFAFQLWRRGEPEALLVDETGLEITQIELTDLAPGSYDWRVAAIQAVPREEGGAPSESDDEETLLKIWGPVQSFNVSDDE